MRATISSGVTINQAFAFPQSVLAHETIRCIGWVAACGRRRARTATRTDLLFHLLLHARKAASSGCGRPLRREVTSRCAADIFHGRHGGIDGQRFERCGGARTSRARDGPDQRPKRLLARAGTSREDAGRAAIRVDQETGAARSSLFVRAVVVRVRCALTGTPGRPCIEERTWKEKRRGQRNTYRRAGAL